MNYNILDKSIIVENIIRRRNSIGIKVIYPNKIEIYSPYKLKEDDILSILSRHKRFISKRIIKEEINNDEIHILGNKYKIEIYEADFDNILVDDYLKIAKIYTKNNNDNYIFKIIDNYYENVLRSIVDKNIAEIKYKMKISFDIKFIYKRVNTYFGECFSKRNLVILNTKLAKYDLYYILSVIYHELAHFYYQNHQAGFYKLLEKVFPNYKNAQKELRRIKYNEKY